MPGTPSSHAMRYFMRTSEVLWDGRWLLCCYRCSI